MKKTNAVRLLDRDKIVYQTHEYHVDEADLSAVHVAQSIGQDINRVFKTLVLTGDKTGFVVACVPGEAEVDLKNLASVSANKKCAMIPMKDILTVTGYIRGGCSPIGMKKLFPTFIHKSALDFPTIYISAGVRGMQIEIAPNDLVVLTKAVVSDII
ncbi:MAG: Cys-tRNA(Pro) deacylase [Paludibacteraceae bacterium]|nr:Cys-tRNA(Pro) deacylase [Paludibacteraceae bacterium]